MPTVDATFTLRQASRQAGLEPALVERIFSMLGFAQPEHLGAEDVEMLEQMSEVLDAGFPLVAFLQLLRVYGQALAQIADAEVRLFHLYVHEPLMRDGIPGLQIAEQMGELTARLLPFSSPVMDHVHRRLLHHFIEQDIVGHMEADLGSAASAELGRMRTAIAFADLAGLHPAHRAAGRRGGGEHGRALRRRRDAHAAGRGADREDDRRRGDARLQRSRGARRLGRRLPGARLRRPAAAHRHPRRRGPLPRRRLLRARGEPRRRASPRAPPPARCSSPARSSTWPRATRSSSAIGEVKLKGFSEATELFLAIIPELG